jgi:hypothetical protein
MLSGYTCSGGYTNDIPTDPDVLPHDFMSDPGQQTLSLPGCAGFWINGKCYIMGVEESHSDEATVPDVVPKSDGSIEINHVRIEPGSCIAVAPAHCEDGK